MILIDTSAWIEHLRATGSAADLRVTALLESDQPPATTEAVIMEVLAGARDEVHLLRLRRLLFSCEFLSMTGLNDYENAAALYRQCRAAGETPRTLADCLIAAVAIRSDADVLHTDRDFDVIARHSSLKVVSLA